MMCPECLSSKVLPIVYGFPSPPLVAALKKSRVLLGGDYLIEGDPSWACGACQSRWRAWPFAWPDYASNDEDRRWAGRRGASIPQSRFFIITQVHSLD